MKHHMFNQTKIYFGVVIATFFMYANLAKAQVVQKGLVSYWSFDGIVGNTVQDDWGKNHGTIKGAPQKVDGKYGSALKLDAANDYIIVPNDDSLNIVDNITLGAWILWNGDTGIIASKRDPVSYQFSAIKDNTIQLCAPTCIYSTPVLSANKWMYIAAVRSGNKVHFYKDGEAVGVFDQPNVWVTNGADLYIGAWHGDGYKYGGMLDELSIYNRALSAGEIKQNFTSKGLAVVLSAGKLTLTWGKIKMLN